MEWSFLRNFAITLFALLNPLGMLPIFISYTARERKQVQRLVALFVSLTVLKASDFNSGDSENKINGYENPEMG